MDRPTVTLKRGRLRREHGLCSWDPDPENIDVKRVVITVDPRNAPLVSVVLHELLHVYMTMLFEIESYFDDRLEEAIILGLEKQLETYINRSRNEKLLQKWSKAIEKKLDS